MAAWVACLGLMAQSAWAQSAPANAPLPNFDKRTAAAPAPALAGVLPAGQTSATRWSAPQQQAISVLRDRVPRLTVDRHALLGSPRDISAREGFLTGPDGAGGAISADYLAAIPAGDRFRPIKAFLNEHAALFGHNAGSLEEATLKRDDTTANTGLRTFVWEQKFRDVPVFEAVLLGHQSGSGELIRLSSQFLPNPAVAAANGQPDWEAALASPAITAAAAIGRAAADIGSDINVGAVVAQDAPEGTTRRQKFKSPELRGDTHAELVWLPMNGQSMRLAWRIILTSRPRREMYQSVVDARTGEVLVRHGLTSYQAAPVSGTYSIYSDGSPGPLADAANPSSPGWPTPNSGQGPLVERVLTNVTSLSAVASPAGWLDPAQNGAFQTTGNNVDAHADWDDNDVADTPRPQSRANPPVFDFTLDLSLPATSYTNAAVVNLFYWNNFMHDRLYDLGFTESAGNFQNSNFGRYDQRYGGDAVEADAQDGVALNDFFHVNNANFATPPDGIPGRMQMYIFTGPRPTRDGDLEAGVICHEYVHGLSNRLVGGGTGIYEYQTAGLGEGWSDFYAACLLSKPEQDPHATYPVGPWLTFRLYDLTENYYYGIRRFPYCTDMSVSPLTFKDIDPTQVDAHLGIPISPISGGMTAYPDEVHNQGEVWCAILWEARANLIDAFGWDEGNQLILQLVTDGMKLSPPNPNFIEARDAILQADQVFSGGANRADLWTGFAKRGLGYSASSPPSSTTIGVVEAYDIPPDVVVLPPTGVMEVTVTPAPDSTLDSGSRVPIYVRLRDGRSVTNATVRGTVDGVTPLTFNNSGQAPDVRGSDSIYSTYLDVPALGTNVTLTLTSTAPGKTNDTRTINYYVAGLPPNDLFAKAVKVRPTGGLFSGSNKRATVENGEPQHAGVATAGASLWWDYTPTQSARVLVDTAGSKFSTVLGVYTGTNVANLKQVAAVGSVPQRKQSYLFFDAQATVTYHIAVASVIPSSAGLLILAVQPNGQPDIEPPLLSLVQPLSGLIITNNFIDVLATAVDPGAVVSSVDPGSFRLLVNPRTATFQQSVSGGSSVVSGSGGPVTNQARVALVGGRNTITVTVSDYAGNVSVPKQVTITYRASDPPNDHFANAILLSGVAGTNSVTTANATKEPGEPNHAGNAGGRSAWWVWRAPQDGTLLLSTEGSAYDTVLALYRGDRVDSLTALASNDDPFDGAGFSKLQYAVRSNAIYHVAVDGFDGARGLTKLAYSFSPTNVFSINLSATAGGLTAPPVGVLDVVANSTATLSAIPDENHDFAYWEGNYASMSNPLLVVASGNLAVKAVFAPRAFADAFESGNLTRLPWTSGGNKPWFVTNTTAAEGRFAARSGLIGGSQSSSLILKAQSLGGRAGFSYKVSSEEPWDVFAFYLDGVLQQSWSGEVDWTPYVFNLSAGQHTLEWRYSKDPFTSSGLDAAFIDRVELPLVVPKDQTTAARLSLQTLADGTRQLRITGQTNQIYVIQAAGRLPAQWQPISTNQNRLGEILFVDPLGLTETQRFYRAVAP